ncbi:hypothetical protein Efla_007717 [Eimeria flavescens]
MSVLNSVIAEVQRWCNLSRCAPQLAWLAAGREYNAAQANRGQFMSTEVDDEKKENPITPGVSIALERLAKCIFRALMSYQCTAKSRRMRWS